MEVDDRPGDGKTQTETARRARCVGPVKPLKDTRKIARVNPRAGIGNLDDCLVVLAIQSRCDRAARMRKANRVVHDMRDSFPQIVCMAGDFQGM